MGRPNDGRSGIELERRPAGNLVEGNFIGTDVPGTLPLPNREYGVFIQSSSNNTVGGSSAAQANLISGNLLDGILIEAADAVGNTVSVI